MDDAILGAYAALGHAPSMVLSATLEDALAVERRPNMPNTVSSQRSNWSTALPLPIEKLSDLELPQTIARSLSASGAVASRLP